MPTCKKCSVDKDVAEFYPKDRTCKECRREMVRLNRQKNIEYYREYDKKRFKEDPRVKQRHLRYMATEQGKEAANRAKKRWARSNPIKRAANVMVGNAIRDGKLIRPEHCSECGATDRIHGHHDDYAKPLVVRWLCPKCHDDWHKENGPGLNAE